MANESALSLIMVYFLHVPTSIGASPGFWGFTLFFACPRLEIRNFLKEFPPPISDFSPPPRANLYLEIKIYTRVVLVTTNVMASRLFQ